MVSTSAVEPSLLPLGVTLVFLTPALGGFLYGYDIGATSFVLTMLKEGAGAALDMDSVDTTITTTHWWKDFDQQRVRLGLTVAALSLGALAGSHLVLFYLAAWMSRRTELRLAALLYCLGSLLNVAAGTCWRYCITGWYALVMGRFLFGAGVGFVMHGAPNYMAEMAPSRIRGAVVAAKETVIVSGIVVGYGAGSLLPTSTKGGNVWVYLYVLSLAVALPLAVLTWIIPRSMRWLLLQGKCEEALRSMQYMYRGDVTEEFGKLLASTEANRLQQQISSTPAGLAGHEWKGRLLAEDIRPALKAALGLICFQQFSGQPSIISYATVLFEAAGWTGQASVVAAVLMLGVSSTTVYFVDRIGRRRMLSLCVLIMASALVVLCGVFWNWKNGAAHEFGTMEKTLALVALWVYIGGYQVGFGPITWLLVAEVFPSDVRGPATALGVELNYLLNFLVQFMLPLLQDHLGWGPTFGIFACFLLVAYYFIQCHIPETTGLTLEEIEQRFARGKIEGASGSLSDANADLSSVETQASNEVLSLLMDTSKRKSTSDYVTVKSGRVCYN